MEAPPKNEPVTRIVDSTGRGQHTSISAAIAVADPGNRILIRPGVYREHLTVDKPLELIGDGKTEEIVLTDSNDDVVDFQTTIGRISNLTIRQEHELKGEGPGYNAVDISQGRLILENCQLSSTSGAVVYVRGGADPQITHNKISSLREKPGVVVAGARGLIENNEISAKKGWGIVVIWAPSAPIVRQNVIRSSLGIGLLEKSSATIDDNDIASTSTGVVVMESEAVVTRNRIHECGTGVRINKGGRAAIEGNTVTNNRTSGIDIESDAQATLTGNILAENGAYGITASSEASVTLGENTFRDNKGGDIERPKSPPPK